MVTSAGVGIDRQGRNQQYGRELVGEGSGALGEAAEVELDFAGVLTSTKLVFKYFQTMFLVSRFSLHLGDLNMWFFNMPEWAFSFGFEFYAFECIFEDNKFLGYMLGKWLGILTMLLFVGLGVGLSNSITIIALKVLSPKATPKLNTDSE